MKGKMTSGSPWRLILVFSLTILLSGLLQQCYNIADTMIVGRFLKLEALTGMGCHLGFKLYYYRFLPGSRNGNWNPCLSAVWCRKEQGTPALFL